jgi:hypothetical protein
LQLLGELVFFTGRGQPTQKEEEAYDHTYFLEEILRTILHFLVDVVHCHVTVFRVERVISLMLVLLEVTKALTWSLIEEIVLV